VGRIDHPVSWSEKNLRVVTQGLQLSTHAFGRIMRTNKVFFSYQRRASKIPTKTGKDLALLMWPAMPITTTQFKGRRSTLNTSVGKEDIV